MAIARIIETRITPAEYDQMRVRLGKSPRPRRSTFSRDQASSERGRFAIIFTSRMTSAMSSLISVFANAS